MRQLDYTVTLSMRGGGTATVGKYDESREAIADDEKCVVGGIRPAPDHFPGTSPRWMS